MRAPKERNWVCCASSLEMTGSGWSRGIDRHVGGCHVGVGCCVSEVEHLLSLCSPMSKDDSSDGEVQSRSRASGAPARKMQFARVAIQNAACPLFATDRKPVKDSSDRSRSVCRVGVE